MPAKLTASLSLDLDNLWSYMKTHGDAGWETFPTYLPRLVPLVLDWLGRHNQRITFFIVGQDAALEANREALAALAQAGHELGNHSFHHEPWMQRASVANLIDELARAEDAISEATGYTPIGFRGPGFACSPPLLHALRRLGYQYDASRLPSVLGPAARIYYLWNARLTREERKKRGELFGHMSDGFAPLRPFLWQTSAGELLEIPVTTIPVLRVPFHLSYIIWLAGRSRRLATNYLRFGLMMCRLRGIEPSFLLHPLDFLGAEDAPELRFFPGMQLARGFKLELAEEFIALYRRWFDVTPMAEHMQRIVARGKLKRRDASRSATPPPSSAPANTGAA